MTYHQMYRRTTLGNTLQETLDEMMTHNLIQKKTALKVIQKFDQCISVALSKRVKNRLSLRGHLNTYRFCDNVWTLVMENVEIKDSSAVMTVDKIKIVACEGKGAKPTTGPGSDTKASTTATTSDRVKPAPPPPVEEPQRGSYLSGGESD